MNTFELVTILVPAAALLVGAIDYVRSGAPLERLGRQGEIWFDHLHDRELGERPSEDELDAPIPRRPLRGRIG